MPPITTAAAHSAPQSEGSETDASEALEGSETDASEGSANETPPEDLIDSMSFDDLDRVLTADPNKLKKPKAEESEDEQDEDEGEEEGKEEQGEDTVGSQESADDTDKPLPKNFRFSKEDTADPKKAKFLQILKRNRDMDPITAAKLAGYELPGAAATTKTDETATSEEETTPPVIKNAQDALAALKAKKAELVKKIKEEAAAYNNTTDLQIELTDLVGDIGKAESALTSATEEHADEIVWRAEYDAANRTSREAVKTRHPLVVDPESIQFALVKAEMDKAQRADPNFVQDPRYPLAIIERLEKKHPTLFPKKPGAAPIRTSVVQNPPNKPARPLGETTAGNRGTNSPLGAKELENEIDKLSFDDLVKLADDPRVGTTPKRRGK